MKESIEDFTFDCCMGDKEPMDDFEAYTEGGRIVIIEFNFGQKLHVEFDINDDVSDGSVIESYFFIRDRNGKLKVNIEEEHLVFDIPASAKSANIMLVYYCLLNNAYWVKDNLKRFPEDSDKIPRGIMPKDIQLGISKLTAERILLSTESIVKHIKALKALGFPITYYKASKEEKEFWKARNKHCNEGYELAPDFLGKLPEPIDASSLGDNINPLLVRFVLQSAKKPMRQNDIIEAILKKYNVSIKRAAVGRHIELLRRFGYHIEKSKDGYIFEK
jgi:biotin operon repressor